MKLNMMAAMANATDETTRNAGLGLEVGSIAHHLRAKLQAAGLNPTPAALALGRLLFLSNDRHVTGDILWREADAMDLPLTPRSIASHLRLFTEAGLLREIALFGATLWYDTNTGSHFHFYDEDAKMLFDMPEHMIPQLNLPVTQGIDISGVDLIVRIRRQS
jgi:Fur family transcriptional regulator, iron response regulator